MDAKSQREAIRDELAWCDGLVMEKARPTKISRHADGAERRDWTGSAYPVPPAQYFSSRPDYTQGEHQHLDHSLVKDQIRGAFSEERFAKLTAPSAVRFITTLENPPKGKLSILDLVTPGDEWAEISKLARESYRSRPPKGYQSLFATGALRIERLDLRSSSSIFGDTFAISGLSRTK